MPDKSSHAFGRPGNPARWTSSAKVGIGTAYHTGCCAWFTLSHGIVNEIFYPTIDVPNVRDFELLITDGRTFCHEEKRDLDQKVEMPYPGALLYRLTNTDPKERYRIVKEVLTDPHRSVLLTRVRLVILKPRWRGRLKIYALLAPHIGGQGAENVGKWCELSTGDLLHAQRAGTHLVFGCSRGFSRRSVGYVGASDGWQDLRNYKMDWEFREAGPGNIALMGDVNLGKHSEFTIGVGFGGTDTSAVTALLQSLAIPFDEHRATFVEQWKRSGGVESRGGGADVFARVSRMVLLAHEDKTFQGAMVASLSKPWGERRGDEAKGGYHVVWTRDLVQSATGLLASGQQATALRALIWLAAIQSDDGGLPQNSWTNGNAFQDSIQLDQTAALLLLATRLRQAKALKQFDPWKVVKKTAAYLIKSGPVTPQERWEGNAGYSPSTLAAVIAGMTGAAEFASDANESRVRDFILSYADWLNAYVDQWTSTQCGRIVSGVSRHYLLITPADPESLELAPDPDHAKIELPNQGGRWPARDIVSGDFLQLVRLGVRDPREAIVTDSLKVIDHALRRKLVVGYGWRRYQHDRYGQKKGGEPYDGRGIGRCWPLLAGERGHYAVACGQSAYPYLRMMRASADEGFLLPEQVWDEPHSRDRSCRLGAPSGSAMPLCWAHAEYLTLTRSQKEGRVFDRIESAFRRFAKAGAQSEYRHEFWSLRYRRATIRSEKWLRVVGDAPATIVWSVTQGRAHGKVLMRESGIDRLWFADLPTQSLPVGAHIEFSFRGLSGWEGISFRVETT